ncbi:hypothetical protein LOD99_13987 [Oopsacas minuta]|uniref:MPN domain-containing protein n=1 Tax=Oopsacas minuta TaxID=111878 RepID=A0AAV7KK93_9METZ|nr:hypothetical protein LOD99_13987 [Oopsacas minuta]
MATSDKKVEAGSYAKASDPADKQRRVQEAAEKESPLNIHIECSALMKIATHCFEKSSDEQVNGFLVGNLRPHYLEVTNAFPLPDIPATPDDYQSKMLKNFKDSGLDFIIIGFYQSVQFGDIDTSELFTTLYDYIVSFQSAAAVLFDIDQAKQGNLELHAYRVKSDPFAQKYKDNFTARQLNEKGIRFNDLFHELEICYKASPLSSSLLYELMQDCIPPSSSDSLNILHPSYLDSSVQSLMKDIEVVSQEFGAITKEQRRNYSLEKDRKTLVTKRREENEKRRDQGMRQLPTYTPDDLDRHVDRPIPVSHYNRLVLSFQLESHAKQAQHLAETGLNKMALAELLNN